MTRRNIIGLTDLDDWLYESFYRPVQSDYVVSFVPPEDITCLIRHYYRSRRELSHRPYSEQTMAARMMWACEEYAGTDADCDILAGVFEDLSGLLGI